MISLSDIFFTLTFLVLLALVVRSFHRKQYDAFLFYLMTMIVFLPMMQYVVFPQYKKYDALKYMYNGWAKVWLEYFLLCLLLYYNFLLYKRRKFSYNKTFKSFIIAYIIVSVPQFISTLNFERSFNGFIISVINPVLYAVLFNRVLSFKETIHISNVGKRIYSFYLIVFVFYFFISIYNIIRGVAIENDIEGTMSLFGFGTGLGPFRDRIVITAFSIFIPALYVSNKSPLRKNFHCFILLWVMFVITMLIGNSRTMYVGFFIISSIIIIFNIFKTRHKILSIIAIGFIVISVGKFEFVDYLEETIYYRFHQKGTTIIESAEEDERLLIWNEAKKASEQSAYLGIGISNYHLVYHKGFSDAHSLYYTELAERGIFGLVYVLSLLLYLFFKSLQLYNKTHFEIFAIISLGILLYALLAYTGNSWMQISQTCFSQMPYFLFIYLSLMSNYKRIINE